MPTKYANENSGVVAFEIRDDAIVVEFAGGATYLYNATKPGRTKVERMKVLACAGRGLATYISRHVRDDYAKRIA